MNKMRIKEDIISAVAFQETYMISRGGNKRSWESKDKRRKLSYRFYKKPSERQDNCLLKQFEKNNSNKILIKNNFKG